MILLSLHFVVVIVILFPLRLRKAKLSIFIRYQAIFLHYLSRPTTCRGPNQTEEEKLSLFSPFLFFGFFSVSFLFFIFYFFYRFLISSLLAVLIPFAGLFP